MYGHLSKKHPAKQSQHVAVAVCTFALGAVAPNEIQLTPAGLFRARDGRPGGVPGWTIDAAIAAQVIARAQQAVGDFVIDYEHQTLNAEKNGMDAPARGWWKGANMVWREGQGLFATDIEWTDTAKAQIAAKEYRYISPVIAYDRATGEVRAILMAALTNYPAIDGLSALVALAAARFHFDQQEDTTVNREQLIALLGLAKDATEEQINAAITALKTDSEELGDLRKALGTEKDGDAVAAVAALKADPAKPDPAKYVPVAVVKELQTTVAALSAKITGSEVDDLVKAALTDGKLLPAQEVWARDLGAGNIEALKGYLKDAPVIAALKGTQTKGNTPVGGDNNGALGDEELAVCKQLGVNPEDYKKTLAAG